MQSQEILDVVSANLRGEAVEYRGNTLDYAHDAWEPMTVSHMWNFQRYVYRIAKPEPKKVKMWQWIYRNPFGDGYYLTLKFYPEDAIVDVDPQLVLIKRAEFTMIEVEV